MLLTTTKTDLCFPDLLQLACMGERERERERDTHARMFVRRHESGILSLPLHTIILSSSSTSGGSGKNHAYVSTNVHLL